MPAPSQGSAVGHLNLACLASSTGSTDRRASERELQLAKARIDKLQIDKATEMKRLELERQGRKLLKDIEFLQRSAELRLQEEVLTQDIKFKLHELRASRKRIEKLKSGAIKQATLHGIQAVHTRVCRELFDEMDVDGGGYLDSNEVRQLSLALGGRLTQSQLDAAMAEMDEDGGGEVDFHEFYAWWSSDKKAAIVEQGTDRAFRIVPW